MHTDLGFLISIFKFNKSWYFIHILLIQKWSLILNEIVQIRKELHLVNLIGHCQLQTLPQPCGHQYNYPGGISSNNDAYYLLHAIPHFNIHLAE